MKPDRSYLAARRQLDGMGVERFEVGIREAKTGQMMNLEWSRAELEAMQKEKARQEREAEREAREQERIEQERIEAELEEVDKQHDEPEGPGW